MFVTSTCWTREADSVSMHKPTSGLYYENHAHNSLVNVVYRYIFYGFWF